MDPSGLFTEEQLEDAGLCKDEFSDDAWALLLAANFGDKIVLYFPLDSDNPWDVNELVFYFGQSANDPNRIVLLSDDDNFAWSIEYVLNMDNIEHMNLFYWDTDAYGENGFWQWNNYPSLSSGNIFAEMLNFFGGLVFGIFGTCTFVSSILSLNPGAFSSSITLLSFAYQLLKASGVIQ